jgi:hypothetical protein
MVGNLKGVRVLSNYRVDERGFANVNYTSDPVAAVNIVKSMRQGGQPNETPFAVTFGVGVTGQQLNTALAKSGLFTMAAAASMSDLISSLKLCI